MSQTLEKKAKATKPLIQKVVAPLTALKTDERDLQQEVRRFANEQIKPLVREMDERAEMSPELIAQLFDLGLMSVEIPEEMGGAGSSFFHLVLAIEELARVDPSVAVMVHVQNVLVINTLARWGTEDQKKRYLPLLARDMVAAYSLSESEAGSDAFAMATTARRDGDHYVLNGNKMWATSAAEAGLFLIFVNADPAKGSRGITGFLVERDTPGLKIGKREDKLGIRASSTCELILEDVRVHKDNLLGAVGNGSSIVSEGLNKGRIGIAAQMVGLAQGALDAAVAYAQERQQFGQRISTYQGVHFPLAEIATEIEAARLMVYNAARLLGAGTPYFKLIAPTSMAKYFASQVAERAASQAIETFGGNGFSKEYPVEKFYRDAKIGKIYEGTSNIQLRSIASTIFQRL